IDRSFIRPSADEAANTEIVKMILAMARSLGIKVVAVGAETEQQIKKLREMKCDGVQGFALAQPMNFADTRAFLAKNTVFIMNAETDFTDIANLSVARYWYFEQG